MQISFLGTKSILKDYWLRGYMPSVTRGIYGNTLTKKNVTLEHIQPKSKRGTDGLFNLALASKYTNNTRKNKPLKSFTTRERIDQYLKQFEGISLPDFNGDLYIKRVNETVDRCFAKNL